MNRYLKKTLIVLSIIVTLLVAGGVIVSQFFQDEVIQVVIAGINKEVNSRIQVQSAHFSVFRKFPNASVEFRNVVMSPAKGFDTLGFEPQYRRQLLVAKSVFAELNLFQLLRKDFRINKIEVHDGKINMLTDKNNKHNFIFWKTATGTDGTTSPIELHNVTLHRVNLYYKHQQSNTVISIYTDKARINGRFASQHHSLGVDLDGTVQHFSVGENTLVNNKPISLSGKLNVDGNNYTIRKSDITLAQVPLKVSGGFSVGDAVNLDLYGEGKNLDYTSFVSLLPEQYSRHLQDYSGKGLFSLNVKVTGEAGNKANPHIEATFGIGKGQITHRPTKIKLSDLSFDGTFTNGQKNTSATSHLHLPRFSCSIGGGSIKGSLSVQNFQKPRINTNISGNVAMGQLYHFIPVKQIDHIDGQAAGNISVIAHLNSFSLKKTSNITQLEVVGMLKLEQASLKLNGHPYRFSHINGTLDLGKEITTDQLSFILNNNDLTVNGRIERVIPYLLGRSNSLYLNANVNSKKLCVDSLLVAGTPSSSTANKENSAVRLPENISFDINLATGVFRYGNFEATQLKAVLAYKPRIIAVKSINFTTMAGTVSGNGTIANDAGNNLRVIGATTLQQIDIRQMFQTFGNFTQNVIRAEHLKGALSGSLTFAATWDNKMRLKDDEIVVESEVELTGGELINFEPLKNLSRFVALEELQNIKFSTLRTQVFVKNKQITLPQTNIASSAFNISGSGIHHFDNSYTYQIRILLSELLAAKARKAKKENSDHEYIEDNKRTSIYLKVTGKGDDFKINYDNKSAKESIAADIRQEKQTLKGILKEEFGWFKKDTTLQPVKSADKSGKLRFSFDEEHKDEATPEKQSKPGKTKGKEDRFVIEEWD